MLEWWIIGSGAWMALAGLLSLIATVVLTSRGFQYGAHKIPAMSTRDVLPVGQR